MSSALLTESTKLRNENCTINVKRTHINIVICNIFKIQWPKSEEKIYFGVGGFGCLNPYPLKTSW